MYSSADYSITPVPYTDPMAIRFSTSTANPWSYDTRSRGWGNSFLLLGPDRRNRLIEVDRGISEWIEERHQQSLSLVYLPHLIMTFGASGRMIPESRRRSGHR